MIKQKAYIVEDEKHNRDMLINLINEQFSDRIEIAGSSASILESTRFLLNVSVDILFLDIELSDGRVFDLLNRIDYKKYKLIFITGYAEHAIKAIKYAAVDYLLKPVNTKELILAINKILGDNIQYNPILEDFLHRKQFDVTEYLIINSAHAVEKILFEEILFLKADGVYTQIIHVNKNTISSKPIGIYEDVLPLDQFIRCHKSFIVNKTSIKTISKRRGLDLTLYNGDSIPVAVRKRDEFMRWYNEK